MLLIKMFIGCKDMVKYCSFYSLLLWQSASWFDNNNKRKKKKKRTKFKMTSNKTVNNVLDKWGRLFPFVFVWVLFWFLSGLTAIFLFSLIFLFSNTKMCSLNRCHKCQLVQRREVWNIWAASVQPYCVIRVLHTL